MAVYAISNDDSETSRNLVKRLSLTFPVLSDPDRRTIKTYGVHDPGNDVAWPAVVIVAKGGRVQLVDVTDNYTKRPSAQKLIDAL